MSLDKVTISGSELPVGDTYGYLRYPAGSAEMLWASGNTIHHYVMSLFPPLSFVMPVANASNASLENFSTTGAISSFAMAKCFDSHVTAIMDTTNGRTNTKVVIWGSNYASYTIPRVPTGVSFMETFRENAPPYGLTDVAYFIAVYGGSSVNGPNMDVMQYVLYVNANVSSMSLGRFDETKVTFMDGAIKIYSECNVNKKAYLLLNDTTGIVAVAGGTARDSNNNPALEYLTLSVPAAGRVVKLLGGSRLMYLVEKADTTLWLYDANNSGEEVMQIQYTAYDPALAIEFIELA